MAVATKHSQLAFPRQDARCSISICAAPTRPPWRSSAYRTGRRRGTQIPCLSLRQSARLRSRTFGSPFQNETRIPSLPVRASSGRGLIYPLTGSSWCTGPELIVALNQGASIEVLQGLRIDFVPNSPRPFEEFARKISRIRKDAKSRGDQVLDSLAKEVGNSAYGKIAQAVAAQRSIPDDVDIRRVFDVETETMRELGPSRISQPMLAAFITGAVRAMVCEALARIHTDHWIGSVTTDGFLSTAAVETIDQSGPIARSFSEARIRISPDDPKLWELKHQRGSSFCTQDAWRRFVLFAQHETTSCEGWKSPGRKVRFADRRGCGILEACARQDIRDTH